MSFKRILRECKWFWQRITRGYADDDLYSLDGHLAKLLLVRLIEFKKHLAGYPTVEYYVEIKDSGTTILKTSRDLTGDDWDEILEEMIFAFKAISTQFDMDIYPHAADYPTEADFAMAKFKWTERERRIERGLLYFSIYFRNLWI